MCGRYTITYNIDQLLDSLDLILSGFDFEPRYNIAPSQRVTIVSSDAPKHLQLYKWGLVPSWAKDPKIGHKMINARGETVAEKPSFRSAFKQRRCLIPANGFYEWQKTSTGKQPMHIHLKGGEIMTFADLWEIWKDAEERELRTFTIITTTPNTLMAPIHDRMPVIVPKDLRADWLNAALPAKDVQEFIQPYPNGALQADRVSSLVNSPRNEGPQLLQGPDTLF